MGRAEKRAYSKQQRRQGLTQKIVKQHEIDAKRIAYHQINIMWAAVFIVAHKHGITGDALMDYYRQIRHYLLDTATADELRQECFETTGLNVEEIIYDEDEYELESAVM